MSPYKITLLLTILGGLVPATWFLVVARRLLSSQRDRALGFVLWAMPAAIWLLYLRSLVAVALGGGLPYPPIRVVLVSIGLGWLINCILWAKLIVFLRRRHSVVTRASSELYNT